jgi:hypothetical protein
MVRYFEYVIYINITKLAHERQGENELKFAHA